MKKALCIVMILALCAALAGCGDKQDGRSGSVSQSKSVNDVLNEGTKTDTPQTGATDQSQNAQDPKESGNDPVYDKVDVDLTKLNSTMVYSEVYNMMYYPDDFLGKTVRMKGAFGYAVGDNRYYFACVIADATACCSQGIEFVLNTERTFPDEYPAPGSEITVVGVFDTYFEGENRYCQLIGAVME